jgi:hypothetical protein
VGDCGLRLPRLRVRAQKFVQRLERVPFVHVTKLYRPCWTECGPPIWHGVCELGDEAAACNLLATHGTIDLSGLATLIWQSFIDHIGDVGAAVWRH